MFKTLLSVFVSLALLAKGSSQREPGKYPLDIKYFEYSWGGSCDPADRAKTHTLRFEICIDYIDFDEGAGGGQARSRNIVEGVNGGGPISQVFFGHQCKGNPVSQHTHSVQDFGFPADYVFGDCHAFTDGDGNPIYYGQAQYLKWRHNPTYSHVVTGYSNKDRFCTDQKLKLFESEIFRTDIGHCWDEERDDGSMEYFKFDLTNCATTEHNFRRVVYTDDSCTTEQSSEIITPEHCLFDFEGYNDGISGEYKSGSFEFSYVECHVAGANNPGPLLDIGDACTGNAECASNLCETGSCIGDIGQDCDTNDECSSGFCDGASDKCATDPSQLASLGDACAANADCASSLCDVGGSDKCVLANGEACATGSNCASGNCDITTNPSNPVCATALLPTGSSCTFNADCASSLCDEGVSDKCVLANGETCTTGSECLSAYCDMTTDPSNAVCATALLDLGEACTTDADCESNTCHGNDNVCTLDLGASCSADTECQSNMCDSGNTNECVLGMGADCMAHPDGCISGSYCDGSNMPTSATCVAQQTAATLCLYDFECASDFCDFLPGQGQCAGINYKKNGESCSSDYDCRSNICTSTTCSGDKGSGSSCLAAYECQSNNCLGGMCQADMLAYCSDTLPCPNAATCGYNDYCMTGVGGAPCTEDSDCYSNTCSGWPSTCMPSN